MVLKVELADASADKEKLKSALDKSFRDTCKVRFDRVEFVAQGIITESGKQIVDERIY
jgi:hypothetical protein